MVHGVRWLADYCKVVSNKLKRRVAMSKGEEPPVKERPSSYSEGYKSLFMSVFPDLVREQTENGLKDPAISDGIRHLQEVMNYNVPGGKCNRGLMVVGSLCHLVGGRELTEEEKKKALILGWCVEWLQAFFLVADDIMDQSKLRRGKTCWYLKEGIGLVAINDSFCLEGTIYKILRQHFRREPYYTDILDLFHEVTYQTELGQTLDLLTSPNDKIDFSSFTMERYKAIVKYKTAFYSFYLPVALAMYMAGIADEQSHAAAKTILLEMGEFFQIQDDFLDCYGDPAVTGKVGTDIEENKCSWLVVQALARVTPQQRETLQANYARNNPECVQKVKALYRELDLEQVYRDYEEESYQRLMGLIEREAGTLPTAMFMEFANRIYKRKH